jgi:polar amino acid transport system substrate-binding protein
VSRTRFLAACLAALLGAGAAEAADLPDAIRSAGTLHLTVNATYPPMEYHDTASNALIGLDIDLANAIAQKLGLKIVWSDVAFAQLMPALQTQRADMIISGLTDRKSRQDTMDFIDYLTTGPQFYVQANSAAKEATDLCGKRVGTVRSTSFPAEIADWSKAHCEAAGKPPIQYVPGENTPDVHNQLLEGRIDAGVQGSETIPFMITSAPGKYRAIGAPFATGLQGIAFRKGDTQLRDVVLATLRTLMADGTYTAILTKYGLQGNAVSEPAVNGGTQ